MKNKYTESEQKKILNSIIILVDTREKKFSHIKLYLKHNKIPFEITKLDFGDYSVKIPANKKLGINEDIDFRNEIAVERKANAEEVSGNLTNDRDRIKREFSRGKSKIRFLIEDTSYGDISDHNYNTDMNPDSLLGSLHSIQKEYNNNFFFCDKEHSGKYIYKTFYYFLRNKLKNI